MATTGRIVYHGDDETIKKDKREFSLTDEIMELINSGGGGGGGIQGVKVNGQIVNPDQAGYVGLTIPGVINNLTSNSTTDALSAKQGKVLYEYIQALQHVGHFLALWDTATGLPVTNPETSPYTYNTGDYYIVSNVAAAGGTNYKPNGSSYTINVASTTVESGDVQVNDLYFYDGYERRLLDNSGGGSSIAVDSSLSTTSTNPVQNAVITNRLNQMALDANTKTFWLTNLQDTTTGQAIRDWVDGGGNAIVYYSGMPYFVTAKSATRITLYSKFTGTQNSPSNQSTGFTEQLMWIDNNNNTITITNTAVGLGAPYLATNQNYATVYTPLYDGSPATKKYVDDKFSAVPVYTAGSNIDITSNQISTIRNGYVYVTCTDGASVQHKTGTSAEGNYTPQEGDLVMVHFTQGCSVGGPDIAIDGGSAIPFYIGVDGANAGNMYFGSNNVSKMFVYTNGRLVGDAVKDNNTLYSAGTGLALSNGVFSNTQPGPTVSATAPANPSEGDMWYDTANDVLKTYDGSNWNVVGGNADTGNVKAFFLEDDEDTTTAQAAIDWANEGKLPLLVLGSETYTLVSILTNAEELGLRAVNDFVWEFSCDNDYLRQGTFTPGFFEKSYITISTSRINDVDTVTSIDASSEVTASVLTTGNSNQTFTPSLNYDPATKKYVDDTVSGVSADVNTKTFYPSGINDITTFQEIVDWRAEGNNPLVAFPYYPDTGVTGYHIFKLVNKIESNGSFSLTFNVIDYSNDEITENTFQIEGTVSNSVYTAVEGFTDTYSSDWLPTNNNTVYTPTGNYNPATKKYVDDKVSGAISTGSTAPSNPTEGMLWYDTTNDVLKTYDGTNWNEAGGGGDVLVSDQPNNILTSGMKIWAGTEANYQSLANFDSNTLYLTVE